MVAVKKGSTTMPDGMSIALRQQSGLLMVLANEQQQQQQYWMSDNGLYINDDGSNGL